MKDKELTVKDEVQENEIQKAIVLKTNDHNPWIIFLIFLRLGLTSFGGPIAHLGYFHDEFVTRRRWLTEQSYADLVALGQFLPGPASSQVGIALGLARGGYGGALAAWLGFTLPSAIALTFFAVSLASYSDALEPGILQGLKLVAVAVVAQAVWGMARKLCTDAARLSIMIVASCAVLLIPAAWSQVAVIALAAVVGLLLFKPVRAEVHEPLPIAVSRGVAVALLGLFTVLIIGLPIAVRAWPDQTLALIDIFYRAGSLVFGGGHVVLPLLQAELVPSSLISNEIFLAGYGAAQAVPGPLFTFAAFLGASIDGAATHWTTALICLSAIFLPSFLLIVGVLPFWEQLRQTLYTQAALIGINAAVVGILLAALYQPVWTSAVHRPQDFALALVAFAALMYWKLPPWLVVLGAGAAGWLLIPFMN